ncbi:MAG: glycine--tRNA ligase [Candidatus Glassbacteria bacterium]|nr:glycine--tRNA ligase [Candidatus Glassbacteria bacterium]
MAANKTETVMDKLVSLCKRRGYIFQSSEIYGGLNSCYDYGPLGVELKRNVKDFWWWWMTRRRDDVDGVDTSILMHPRVWEASGHVEGFTDPLVDCRSCKRRFRADQIDTSSCPNCGKDTLTEARKFNLMFRTHMGPVEDESSEVFLRPETAQGIFVNFLNVQTAMRRKVPFGIAQIGKAFRNEITPGNFVFRTREFEQMEMQYFVKPGTDEEWFEKWRSDRMEYYLALGLTPEKLRWREHGPDELAHYARTAFDIEYEFPFGWQELEGVHNRTDFDLRRHNEYCGKKNALSYFDEASGERFVPFVVETSAGCDRTLLTCLVDAYREEEDRVVLGLSPRLAPIKAGVFPLVKKEGMVAAAKDIYERLKPVHKSFYDEGGSIGRRYRRQDEAGTPLGITTDGQTLEDGTVTIRERDSMDQHRVKIDEVVGWVTTFVEGSD